MEIGKLFAAGGIVMWPLLGFSVSTLALVGERIRFWVKVNTRQPRVIKEILNFYRSDNVVSAIDTARKNADLPMVRIFLAALELDEPTPEEFRLALESEAQAEIPLLKRFTVFFDTVVTVAPLLGLLGTVLGLITSFASLNIGDLTGEKTVNVSSGISEALVSTAAGLIVAIPTLFFANAFRGVYQRQIALIQEYGGELELLYRHRYERGEKSYASTR